MANLAINSGAPVRTDPFPSYPQYGEPEAEAAAEAVRSGVLCAGMRPKGQGEVAAFEREFAAYCGATYAIATSNGTTALHVALAACDIGAGDEVIVPPYTYISTATSVLMQNAVPVFADIEPVTLGLDPASVRERITPRTKGIIVVHMNGIPADLEALMALVREHGLMLIEDCSHAHGAEHAGSKVGTFGHINAFSLQQKKNLSVGEGGILVTDGPALAEKAREVRNFGARVGLAWNFRMTEVHGAIGRVRLRRLDEENQQRVCNAEILDEGLRRSSLFSGPSVRPGDRAVYYNYVVRYHQRDGLPGKAQIIKALCAEGIPAGYGYRPLYRHSAFHLQNAYGRGCPFTCPFREGTVPTYEDGICPVTERICDREAIELKIHPPAGEGEMRDIVTAFAKLEKHIDELS